MSNKYSYLGIQIDRKNPEYVNDFSRTLLEGHYVREGETIPQALARPATAFCFGDYALAQRIYDYVHAGWFMYASPVLSNAPKGKWVENKEKNGAHYWYNSDFIPEEKVSGLPISCFAAEIPDTALGQVEFIQELATLSMAGGGMGAHNSVRGTSGKAPGPIPFMKVIDSSIGYFKQSGTRRGAIAVYMDINHPDIREHIRFRVPGGDAKRRSDNRQQFHSAVNISDDFIQAVLENKSIDLVCPHSKKVFDTVRARSLWEDIIETRALTGEPYLFKKDLANRKMPESQKALGLEIKGSNLCVAPETLILTDSGYKQIHTLEGKAVNVWNGVEFSSVVVEKTGVDQEVILVTTNSGQVIECTPYHKFYVKNDYHKNPVETLAENLTIGDKLIKSSFPIIQGSENLTNAYENGFFSGDGCVVSVRGKQVGDRIYLYGDKRELAPIFKDKACNWTTQENQNREYFYYPDLQEKYFVPGANFTIKDRLSWLAGLIDSDGCLLSLKGSQTMQIASAKQGFLEQIQLMLNTLGVSSKVKFHRAAGVYLLPANDGSGELKEYECNGINRLLISGNGIVTLLELGLKTFRVRIENNIPNRNAEQFPEVASVVRTGRKCDTFCVNEPKEHKVVFNGLLTGNCSEITLPTDSQRTFVCCLSSLNLEKYEEWKDTNIVQDLIRFLDNVLQYFIDNAPDTLSKAKYSAERERALGLGTLGWHSLLQSKMIPFESGGFNSAVQLTNQVYKLIHDRALESSRQLALERGEAPDMKGTGLRNSRLSAVA